jgi:hypothetical protein
VKLERIDLKRLVTPPHHDDGVLASPATVG